MPDQRPTLAGWMWECVCDEVHRHQACFGSQGESSHCKCNMLFILDVKASRQEQQRKQAAVASHFTAAPHTKQHHITDLGLVFVFSSCFTQLQQKQEIIM